MSTRGTEYGSISVPRLWVKRRSPLGALKLNVTQYPGSRIKGGFQKELRLGVTQFPGGNNKKVSTRGADPGSNSVVRFWARERSSSR